MKSSRPAQIRTGMSTKNDREDKGLEEEADHYDDVLNMINALREVQRKKGKPAGRSEFQKKKLEKYNAAREQGSAMVRDTLAFINDIKAAIEDMKSQEIPASKSLQELPSLLDHRDECGRSVLREFLPIVSELSPKRATEVDDASAALEDFIAARDESRKRTFRNTREYLAEGLEQHRLAIDASDLIKNYKALLRS